MFYFGFVFYLIVLRRKVQCRQVLQYGGLFDDWRGWCNCCSFEGFLVKFISQFISYEIYFVLLFFFWFIVFVYLFFVFDVVIKGWILELLEDNNLCRFVYFFLLIFFVFIVVFVVFVCVWFVILDLVCYFGFGLMLKKLFILVNVYDSFLLGGRFCCKVRK